jgi:hypothetical protein
LLPSDDVRQEGEACPLARWRARARRGVAGRVRTKRRPSARPLSGSYRLGLRGARGDERHRCSFCGRSTPWQRRGAEHGEAARRLTASCAGARLHRGGVCHSLSLLVKLRWTNTETAFFLHKKGVDLFHKLQHPAGVLFVGDLGTQLHPAFALFSHRGMLGLFSR